MLVRRKHDLMVVVNRVLAKCVFDLFRTSGSMVVVSGKDACSGATDDLNAYSTARTRKHDVALVKVWRQVSKEC